MDLSWLVAAGSDNPIGALITGMFGVYPCPSLAEVVGWLLYAVPMLTFVLWPQPRPAAAGWLPRQPRQLSLPTHTGASNESHLPPRPCRCSRSR